MMDQKTKTELPPMPNGWGDDPLSAFIQQAHGNTLATFQNLRGSFARLRDIHVEFSRFVNGLNYPSEVLPPFFALASHSSYLGAVRHSLSGQTGEAVPILRSCLESALYAFFVQGSAERAKIWLSRHESDATKAVARETFTVSAVIHQLAIAAPGLEKPTRALYDELIDVGGHPNERFITSRLKMHPRIDEDSDLKLDLVFLSADPEVIRESAHLTARVGTSAMHVLGRTFPERFSLLGIDKKLAQISQGHTPISPVLSPVLTRVRKRSLHR